MLMFKKLSLQEQMLSFFLMMADSMLLEKIMEDFLPQEEIQELWMITERMDLLELLMRT